MNNNRYLLDIERLKKLEPIMQRCGVEASHGFNYRNDKYHFVGLDHSADLNTYDHYALESVLKGGREFDLWTGIAHLAWALDIERINYLLKGYKIPREIVPRVIELYKIIVKSSHQQIVIEALADLIILLDENGIELKEVRDE